MGDEGKAVSFPRLTALLFEATAAGNSSLSYCAFPAAPLWTNPFV